MSEGQLGTDVFHSGLRGGIAAMAMTGMRTFTVDVGIVEQTPPQAIAKQRRARGLLRRVPRKRRGPAVELAHWSYGALGGAGFGLLPEAVRRRAWAGPVYGLLTWLGFEIVVAPTLGLSQARELRLVDRGALAVDHLLYGLVLFEGRSRPQA